ncbi:response regulator transcription factor [Phaeodactylibacter sp.]|jgi:DNA-binding NarL/FixJ family response regulator|uniref:response regulator n=1 Tax=Phaeodactylibacter sp. TaxID=1940289 RepID=UPI0025F393B7|nr:response regulator transcription factor [Phaeodactylibacter sp.]MCI4651063.1 response regulator transcription factor [Phaeodactylibacter sp.]MCI5092091.1 response regulator transcription factor [Phaeodactylibacter sp.]
MKNINLGIIEDEPILRKNIDQFFSNLPGFELQGSAASVEAFVESVAAATPLDILLLDISLPGGMSGLEGITLLKERYQTVDIIMWSSFEDPDKIFRALQAGADSYLIKRESLTTIRDAIQTVANGGAFMSPSIARKVIDHFATQRQSQSKATPILTDRQLQIVDGLVSGLSYKMVGAELGISVETVRDHIKKIYKRLHVNSKAEVIRKRMNGEI